MKKLLLLLFVTINLSLNAQYLTNFAKNVNTKDTDGFYYSLPRTIIRLDFEVVKNQNLRGKYSVYTKELIDTDDFIKENTTTYRINNVKINILNEADPNYTFFISFDEKTKDNTSLNLALTTDGVIQSFGYEQDNNAVVNTNSSFENTVSKKENYSEYKYILLDDEFAEEDSIDSPLTDKDIAASIVEEIKKIRIAYFDLITGYQEVNYGNTLNYMAEEIKKLEEEYLSLFLGKTYEETYTESFYIIPEEEQNNFTVGKFSASEGFNSKSGDIVKIYYTESSTSQNINKMSKDDIENATYINKMFYRNPANVRMQIMHGDTKISDHRITVSQFGNIVLVPMNKMKLVFDTNTGQILSAVKK